MSVIATLKEAQKQIYDEFKSKTGVTPMIGIDNDKGELIYPAVDMWAKDDVDRIFLCRAVHNACVAHELVEKELSVNLLKETFLKQPEQLELSWYSGYFQHISEAGLTDHELWGSLEQEFIGDTEK